MTGKGGSSSKSTTKAELPPSVTKAQEGQVGATMPVLQELAKQMMEALQTGGVNARIPIAQRATEAGMNAAATTNRQTREGLARANITGPYARGVEEGVSEKGAFDVSQINPQMMQQLLTLMPDFALMRGSPVFGGGSSASTTTTKGTGGGDMLGSLGSLFQGAASIGALFL